MNGKVIGVTAAAIVGLAAPAIMLYEGYVPQTYADPVGINTICYGHTGPDVYPGQISSRLECEDLLHGDLATAINGVESCVYVPLKPNEAAALVSFTFNVGVPAFCGSTMVRLINTGAPPEVWCHQIMRWDKATRLGVKVQLRGLTKRRKTEFDMCLNTHWQEDNPRPVDFSNIKRGVTSTARFANR